VNGLKDHLHELSGWLDKLNHIRLGGEQGYGWGKVQCICCENIEKNKRSIVKIISLIQMIFYGLVSSQPYNVSKYAINTPYNPTL